MHSWLPVMFRLRAPENTEEFKLPGDAQSPEPPPFFFGDEIRLLLPPRSAVREKQVE